MKKVGIITFHNSYNCGSMLESYAMQESIKKRSKHVEIINFSNVGQRKLYALKYENNSIKNIIKNFLIFPYLGKIKINNEKYNNFKKKYFNLSREYFKYDELSDDDYDIVVSGSDQIWNITIQDYDDAYFLPWVHKAKKVAYAPSFGARRIENYTDEVNKYKQYLLDYTALSIRENNGQKWIKELTNIDVPVLIDPTLLLDVNDYEKLVATDINEKDKYIFLYCPSFDIDICKFVKKISKKYKMKVITWSCKSYCTKFVKRFGFELAEYENPSSYLYYIKNAELVFTTSFHGTIFSTIYKKKFFTIKNGGMYGNDDRVLTLLNEICMMDRLIPYDFDDNFNYFKNINYKKYELILTNLKKKANQYLDSNIK